MSTEIKIPQRLLTGPPDYGAPISVTRVVMERTGQVAA
jgi:hypothetical protein